MTRYSLRRDDHPEGNRWSVIDAENGAVADHGGQTLQSLPHDDAEDILEALNDLADNEPAPTPNV